jgi:hypothetical protein
MRIPALLVPGLVTTAAAIALGCSPEVRSFGSGGQGGGGHAASSVGSVGSGGAASAGSGGASSSSAGGASSASAASSSSGGGVETDCTNGIDDDGDGLVDCADPDCGGAGYTCSQAVPTGWNGPVVLYTGANPPPACADAWTDQPVSGGFGVKAAPATCTACACGPTAGSSCVNNGLVHLANNPTCGGGSTYPGNFGQCQTLSSQPFLSARVDPIPALGGSCAPVGGAASVGPAAFKTQAAACEAPTLGGGCNAGGVCAPKAPPGYGAPLCVYQAGDVSCPAAFPQKTTVFGSITDDRSCSACSCGAPSGGTCNALLQVFTGPFPGCLTSGPAYPFTNGNCVQLSGQTLSGFILLPNGAPMGGSCAPSGGAPTGAAQGAKPVTVCCP